jgi:hypothetical protein
MWMFHWHHTDDEGKELTTTQTSVPIGEPVPLPPDVAANTLTGVTLEPQEEAAVPTEAPSVTPSSTSVTVGGDGAEPITDLAAGLTP